MFDLIVSGIILSGLYFFLYRGYLFRWIMWSFGYYGLAITFDRIPLLHQAPIVAFDYPISWAFLISLFITLAALITTKISQKRDL